jgi:hypothetical protein
MASRLKNLEPFWWTAIAALMIFASIRAYGPRLYNDSFQYLSEAQNLKDGHGLTTSIVHFDVERRAQRIPAPLTTFPPGYAAAIVALSTLGLKLQTSAVVCSALASLATVWLVFACGRFLKIRTQGLRAAMLLLLVNSDSLQFSSAVLSESVFTCLVTAGVFLLMRFEERGAGNQLADLVIGSILVGLACTVRYAGLFVFAGVAVYFVVRALLDRDGTSSVRLLGLAPAGAILSIVLLRNELLAGTWKGGNTKVVHHSIWTVAKMAGTSIYHLFFSPLAVSAASKAALVAGMAGMAWAVIGLFTAGSPLRWQMRRSLQLALVVIAVYLAGMLYLGANSSISFGGRMLYPLLPLTVLLLAAGYEWIARCLPPQSWTPRAWFAFAAALYGTCLVTNSYANLTYVPRQPVQAIHELLKERLESGESLRSWLNANVPKEATIVASEGQATAYLLNRKTVSLVEEAFSDQTWDENAVRLLMFSHDTRFLLLYAKQSNEVGSVLAESPILQSLARGEVPSWLTLVAETLNTKVYRFRAAAP